MVKGIIFDLGGVLMHMGSRWREVDELATTELIESLRTNGVVVDKDFRSLFGYLRQKSWDLAEQTELEPGMHVALQAALGNSIDARAPACVTQAIDAYFKVREQYWVANPGALQVLEQLGARGLLIGAISNAEHDGLMQQAVRRLGFAPHLLPIVTSAQITWRKPNPRIFQHVAKVWGLKCSDIVMIGDDPLEDIAGAHSAGMRAILLERGNGRRPQQMADVLSDPAAEPDAAVKSLGELGDVVAGM